MRLTRPSMGRDTQTNDRALTRITRQVTAEKAQEKPYGCLTSVRGDAAEGNSTLRRALTQLVNNAVTFTLRLAIANSAGPIVRNRANPRCTMRLCDAIQQYRLMTHRGQGISACVRALWDFARLEAARNC